MERVAEKKEIPVGFLLKCILCSYLFTVAMLGVLAALLYKVGLTEKVVAVAIMLIYVASTFLSGFMAGRKMENRKFLWGLLLGCLYFGILAVVSMLVNQSVTELGDSVMTTFVLCAAGGMLGGMFG